MRMTAGVAIVTAERLAEYRERSGLTQKQAASLFHVGEKLISSYETGARIDTIKVVQLLALLDAYGVSMATFAADVDRKIIADFRRTA